MASAEDMIVQQRYRDIKKSQQAEKESNPNAGDAFLYPEVHYNHYGTRGYADAYFGIEDWNGTVVEVKSESAVRNSTGANEILRQYNKMRGAFFDGSQHEAPTDKLHFELCFELTEYNVKHLREHADLYRSAVEDDIGPSQPQDVSNLICCRDPEINPNTPLIMFRAGRGWEDPFDYRTFREGMEDAFLLYVKGNVPDFFADHEELVREMNEDEL